MRCACGLRLAVPLCQHVVFTHFSARYSKEMVETALAAALPAEFMAKVLCCTVGLSGGAAEGAELGLTRAEYD